MLSRGARCGASLFRPMDTTSIIAKTAKGIVAIPEDEDLNYDGVRLLRLINGKASIGELRSYFADLTDVRFEKAIATLQRKGLVHALNVNVQAPGDRSEMPGLDAQVRELGQEVLQTLDFSSLEHTLLDAMRSSPAKTDSAAPTATPMQPAATQPAIEARADPNPNAKVRPPHKSRPTHEAEIRAQLMSVLRPKVEDELRTTLTSALRPALEAEIRTKLTAALKPRVELELRARLNAQLARPAPVAAAIVLLQRLLECLQEAVFQNDLAGKNVYVNPALTRLTLASVPDTIGRPFAEFFTAEDQKGVALFLDRIARGRETPPWVEASLARKTGEPLRIELRAAPLTTVTGETIGVCGTLHAPGAVPNRGK